MAAAVVGLEGGGGVSVPLTAGEHMGEVTTEGVEGSTTASSSAVRGGVGRGVLLVRAEATALSAVVDDEEDVAERWDLRGVLSRMTMARSLTATCPRSS